MPTYRFENKFEKQKKNDLAALAEACSWCDDRPSNLEKLIDGNWCYHSTPISHPHLEDGGWVLPNGDIIISCKD